MMKRVLEISVALLVALGAGWVWGASGRSDLTRALRIAELRDSLLEGRAQADTKPLELALAKIDQAQRMAGQLNQDANALAADASKAISVVLDTTAKR